MKERGRSLKAKLFRLSRGGLNAEQCCELEEKVMQIVPDCVRKREVWQLVFLCFAFKKKSVSCVKAVTTVIHSNRVLFIVIFFSICNLYETKNEYEYKQDQVNYFN